jgi:GGDEF domain-containing protein
VFNELSVFLSEQNAPVGSCKLHQKKRSRSHPEGEGRFAMHLFDKIERRNLERRELQLWLLATIILLVMTAGLALLMYPAVFSHPIVLAGKSLRVAYFGFCVLSVLLISYLLDRQIVVRQLRRRIAEHERRIVQLHVVGSVDLLKSLPNWAHFQDRLTMEFRRVAHLGSSLSVLAIRLTTSPAVTGRDQLLTAEGDAAKAISRKLRRDDSLYRFCDLCFGIVMPSVTTADAKRIAERLKEGLDDAAGINSRFTSRVAVFNYPEHAATAQELEQAIHSLLPDDLLTAALVEAHS